MGDQQSHNDPDAKRAELIRKAREQNIPLSELDDPVIQQLAEYRDEMKQRGTDFTADKEEVWERINTATQPEQEESPAIVTKLFSSSSSRWAAAAILIIGVLSSVIYMQFFSQQKELLAQAGSSITTATLSDGSTVTLRPHSRLYVTEQSDNLQSYHLQGEAFFDVTEQQNRTFSVATDMGQVSVLGTRFNLSSWGKQLQVYLEEGSVEVKATRQDDGVILKPGESASITDPKAVPTKQTASADEFTDWIDGELVFEDKPVKRIASELEQQFNVTIRLPDRVARQQLTGRLALDELDIALQDLELALNGSFKQTRERRYIFEANSP